MGPHRLRDPPPRDDAPSGGSRAGTGGEAWLAFRRGEIDAFDGKTDAGHDDLLDTLAAVCAIGDPTAVASLYSHEALRVPALLIR